MDRQAGLLIALILIAQNGDARVALPACAAKGAPQRCTCDIERLRPTQGSVGLLHVRDILEDSPSKLQERALKTPTEVVIGPDQKLYVTDGHHHARAMLEQLRRGLGPSTTVCHVVEDDTTVDVPDREAFLTWLAGRHEARLNGGDDVNGTVQPGLYPPESLAGLTDDSYRSLASFMEDGCGFKMEGDYGQFPLADLLRHARVQAPTDLAHKKQQGRRAAAELVAKLGEPKLRTEFLALSHHDDIGECAAGAR